MRGLAGVCVDVEESKGRAEQSKAKHTTRSCRSSSAVTTMSDSKREGGEREATPRREQQTDSRALLFSLSRNGNKVGSRSAGWSDRWVVCLVGS